MASVHIHPSLLYSAGTILPVVCTLIVGARFATRRVQKAKLGADDWLTVPALTLIIGMGAGITVGTAQKGLGTPTPPLAPGENPMTALSPQQKIARMMFMIMTILQPVTLAFIKLSCMFFYLRIFAKGSSRGLSIVIYIFNVLVVIWGLAFPLSFLFGCRTHFNYLWTTVANQLKCEVDLAKVDMGLAVSDVVMDVLILLFPIPLIIRLQLSGRTKMAVLGIFTLGAFSIVASVMRLVILVAELSAEFAATADQDFVSTAAVYFMYIECGFALCAICLPTLYGSLKLKGVRTLIEGFTGIFSNLSRSSLRTTRSGKSRGSKARHDDQSSMQSYPSSESRLYKLGGSYEFNAQAIAENQVRKEDLSNGKGITVIDNISQHSSEV